LLAGLASPTHPDPARWCSDRDPVFTWRASDVTGVKGFSYSLSRTPDAVPDHVIDSTHARAAFHGVGDGKWYFHVCACDVAGNWSAPQSLRVQVDTVGPSLSSQSAAQARHDDFATLRYSVSDLRSSRARVTILVLRGDATGLVIPVGWVPNGSHLAKFRCALHKGSYRCLLRARDEAGNREQAVARTVLIIH
jgi:hypothetical protein